MRLWQVKAIEMDGLVSLRRITSFQRPKSVTVRILHSLKCSELLKMQCALLCVIVLVGCNSEQMQNRQLELNNLDQNERYPNVI